MNQRQRPAAFVPAAGLGLLLLTALPGCLPSEPAEPTPSPDGGTTVAHSTTMSTTELNCDGAATQDRQVVPPPCEVMACWHQPAELVAAVEFVRVGREEGLEEYVRIEPDGAYEVMIVQDGEIVEQYESVLTPAAVAELAGLLHDWETDAQAITFLSDDPSPLRGEGRVRGEDAATSTLPQPLPEREGGSGADTTKGGESGTDSASQECSFSCGRYEITYAGRTCGWPAACAVVPRALKCVVLKVIDGAALERGCVRLEFLDR